MANKKDWWKILIGLFVAFLISKFFLPAIISINFTIGMLIFIIFTIADFIIYSIYGVEIIYSIGKWIVGRFT